MDDHKARLEELRAAIHAENISYGEIAELQGLAEFIDKDDVELLEWAGVPEFPEGVTLPAGKTDVYIILKEGDVGSCSIVAAFADEMQADEWCDLLNQASTDGMSVYSVNHERVVEDDRDDLLPIIVEMELTEDA